MKILFLESHEEFINGLPYGFVKAGHEVVVSGDVTESRLSHILELFKPELIFTLGWTFEHSDKKVDIIANLINNTKLPIIYWATEDPIYYRYLSLPLVKKLNVDFVFTVSTNCVESYNEQGIPSAKLDFAYSSLLNKGVNKELEYDISLVANAYPSTFNWKVNHQRLYSIKTLLYPLVANSIKVDIWDNYLEDTNYFSNIQIPSNWIHDDFKNIDIASIFSGSKINLCLQNYTDDTITMRTFEILGSGGFLITSPNQKLYELFDEDKELVISNDPDETLALIGYYLRHENERNKIKEKAMSKIIENHTYKHRAEYAIRILKKEGII